MRNFRDYILLFSKGITMGAAGAVPGVSGGTVAFITGIYEELLHSIKAIDIEAMKMLMKFEFASFWKKINGNFLIVLTAGVVTSLLSLAKVMNYCVEHYPISIWSFFFGLILISAPLVLREIKKWSPLVMLSFVMGIAVAYATTLLSPMQSSETWFFIFLAGALAVCSLILPGLSWAFMLFMIGQYKFVSNAINELNIAVILVFMTGCLAGIIAFSRFLSWVLDNYHSVTVALLAGFMIGSLNKVWPWREVLEYVTNSRGEQVPVFDKSILPWHYIATTSKDPQVFQAILMMALGVFIVVLMEKIATRLKTKI